MFETNESLTINVLALLLLKRTLHFWNWWYHPSLSFLGVADNNKTDEFIV